MRKRDRAIQRRGHELLKLIERQLPQEFDVPTVTDAWPAIGVGLLSRMATTLRFTLDLQRRDLEADASILARSLYEHAVHFAWLAAKPSTRLVEWRRHDLTQRLRVNKDMTKYGRPMFTPEKRRHLEAERASLGGRCDLRLKHLAVLADRYWITRVLGFSRKDRLYSFRGLYSSLYRSYSSFAHPSAIGLYRVADDLGGGKVRVRREHPEPTRTRPYGMAVVVFALALFVASESIGWPPAREVHEVFDRYPVDDGPRKASWVRGCLSLLLSPFRRS